MLMPNNKEIFHKLDPYIINKTYFDQKINFTIDIYYYIMNYLPTLKEIDDKECIRDFNKHLWRSKKNELDNFNFFKEDIIKQLITFLFEDWEKFWYLQDWNKNLETVRRLKYMKEDILWIPKPKQLIKLLLF